MAFKPNYAIKPTPEQALRSNRAILPARLIAALGLTMTRLAFYWLFVIGLAHGAGACEVPEDEGMYVSVMEEERLLVHEALGMSDLVLVGKVTNIRDREERDSLGARISLVTLNVKEVLKGTVPKSRSVVMEATLHSTIVSCFRNEAFWDDQVEVGSDYIIFGALGKILSASPPSKSWHKLGLAGQREVVRGVVGTAVRPN